MKKQAVRKTFYHNKKGFSLAELMMAVAIIGILAGVAFISVANYMRSMAFLERNGIAKEIFVAAQNHLTMADGQGFLGIKEYGTPVGEYTTAKGNKIQQSYFYAVNRNGDYSDNKMLGQLLPFGSIDETVRGGGKYIVHYALNPARVLNVFYFGEGDNVRYPYSGNISDVSVLNKLVSDFSGNPEEDGSDEDGSDEDGSDEGRSDEGRSDEDRSDVGRFYGEEGAVIGYFGENEVQSVPTVSVKAPIIKVINGDRLVVKITDPNTEKVRIRLVVEQGDPGQENRKKAIKLIKNGDEGADTDLILQIDESKVTSTNVAKYASGSDPIVYVLDDITTANLHFSYLFSDFTAGDDITVYAEAEAYDPNAFSNIATSSAYTVNSLYADDFSDDQNSSEEESTAYISSIRHLENLDRDVSNVKEGLVTKAIQISDLSWLKFSKNIREKVIETDTASDTNVDDVASENSDTEGANKGANIYVNRKSTNGYFYPVYPWENLSYEGSFLDESVENAKRVYYKISDIGVGPSPKEDTNSVVGVNAGLFAKLDGKNKAKIKDLELVDFIVAGSGGQHVGALAGEAANVEFENIVVYNTSDFDKTLSKKNVTAESGSAGGLIGKITEGKITKCAAALTVQGNNAGGLVGDASGCEITNSYSGGHTRQGNYAAERSNAGRSNQSGGNTGSSNTGEGTFSSSPYNVMGIDTAGGFAGRISSTKIENCYSTCSAASDGSAVGGFIGSGSGTVSDCYCTGLVSGANAGAFAGSGLDEATNCLYFEIINEKVIPEGATDDTVTGYEYLKAGSKDKDIGGVSPLDEDIERYDSFFQKRTSFAGSGSPRVAKPYDTDTLGSAYFGNMLESEDTQNGVSANPDETVYVKTHYGDWPTPEILVINEIQTP